MTELPFTDNTFDVITRPVGGDQDGHGNKE